MPVDRPESAPAGTEPAEPDEFALLADNAAEIGLTQPEPPVVRRVNARDGDGRTVSALRWGTGAVRVVLLHGGGQNAHTWDTVALALGLPALAVDLPGHGRSDWRDDRDYTPWTAAEALAPALRQWAADADVVVGMSLGGLTTIRLTAVAPDLVRRAVIVDVTPSALLRHAAMTRAERGTTVLVEGPASFDTQDEMIALAAAAAPRRPRSAVARGVVHNSRRGPDGRWYWRYDRRGGRNDYTPLWADVAAATAPLVLVRGGASAFVSDADAEEFVRRAPGTPVHVVAGASHSVQSDAPLELAAIIRAVIET